MTINDTLDIPLPLAPYLLGCDLGVVGFMRKKSAGLSCASKDDLDAACAWGAAAVVTPVSARKCRAALAKLLPENVETEIRLVWEPPWNPSMMDDATKQHFGWTPE